MKKIIIVMGIFTLSIFVFSLFSLPTANFLQPQQEVVYVTQTQNYLDTPYVVRFEEEPKQELTILEVDD
jgi:hypothetical protein